MSAGVASVEPAATLPVGPARRFRADHLRVAVPLAAAAVNAAAFLAFTPNVGDLQAALARAAAAGSGVGPAYWFQWFGGGATPGNYSVITPWLSSVVGAALLGALATVAITLLTPVAARGTAHPTAATWTATFVAAFNLWSGRVPFALGTAVALCAFIAVRRGFTAVACALTILSGLCSPVTAAFLAFVLGAAFLVEPPHRRRLWPVVAVAAATLLSIALFFGSPGPQPYPILSALLLAALGAVWMFIARPVPSVRITLWLTAIGALLLSLIPNGLGSNWTRMTLIWLPAAVVATATTKWWRTLLAVLPALIMGVVITSIDLSKAANPAASASYYDSLITQLNREPLANYRLEVVQNTSIHTAAYALIGHAALAGGYETQEQAALNSVLSSPDLDAASYKLWLDNNAVGYVAFNRRGHTDEPEYDLVERGGLPYLTEVSSDANWILYRVRYATPIIPKPARLISAGQAALTFHVPCACTFPIRVRYSNFLSLRTLGGGFTGVVRDDGTGWTVLRTPIAGSYRLSGSVTQPFAPR